MTLLTLADVQQWRGLAAQDPYGEALGHVAEILVDRESGAPEWLLLAAPDERDGRPVPLAGCRDAVTPLQAEAAGVSLIARMFSRSRISPGSSPTQRG